jgi:ribosomal protein L11 methylase PrmA
VASDAEFVHGAAVVLAGRIQEYRLDVVQAIVERHRGLLLTTIPERWVCSDRRASDRDSA